MHEQRRPLALSRERRANPAEALASPAFGQADDDHSGVARRLDQRVARRVDEHRLSRDTERPLDGERRIPEQHARVAGAVDGGGTDDLQRRAGAAGEPAAELDRRPVVLGSGEGDDDGALAQRTAHEHRDVARRVVEQRDQPRVLERPLRRGDEHEIRHAARSATRARSAPGVSDVNAAARTETVGSELVPAPLEPRAASPSSAASATVERDDDVGVGVARERRGRRHQSGERRGVERADDDRRAAGRTLGRAARPARLASCWRIARSSSRSSSPGSIPSSATSRSRPSR